MSETHLRRALELAERGLFTTDPNPRVGCVIVKDGQVRGEGWHQRAGEPHAEVFALREAGEYARGADAFVTLEPCSHTGRTPPCADALIAAGVARVWCCGQDPSPKVAGQGFAKLRAAGIEVSTGVLADEAQALNVGFFSRFQRGRPYVRLKMAMSLDGRTASASAERRWISGESSRQDVQYWRARSSAVLTGSGTVKCDDPQLNVRLAYGPWVRQPLRVVLDTELNCDWNAQVFRGGGALVFAADDAKSARAPSPVERGPVKRVARSPLGLDLHAVCRELAALEINELLLECGARLAGAFLAADLVDEMILYVAPHLLGDDAAPLAAVTAAALAGRGPKFEFQDARRIGEDVRLTLTKKH
jgi:diaminohydroxyphosphoribosylaminopyrimidine deaminase/5-amino-6-(5-phosphoribosylamino)uracil reductase